MKPPEAMKSTEPGNKVITGMRHGGHAIADDAAGADQLSKAGWTKLSYAVQEPPGDQVDTTQFDYLFQDLIGRPDKHLPADDDDQIRATVLALNELGTAMIDQEPPPDDRGSPIPPVYTYFGQFVDHDMTAATDNDTAISIRDPFLPPLAADDVRRLLVNARNPLLNLDSVYGNGPFVPRPADPDQTFVPYREDDPPKLVVGTLTPITVGGVRIPPVDDFDRDLPRNARRVALIGDARNDENLVVAQLHTAFLRFHNAVVDALRADTSYPGDDVEVFARARQTVEWIYQWVVVNDFLKTVLLPGTVEEVLAGDGSLFKGVNRPSPYTPLEFSVAAYRFGHSMVRGSYDWNRNFGRPGNNVAPAAGLAQLFQFTGTGGFIGGTPTLPSNWPAEWNRLVDKDSLFTDRFARRIDTHLSFPLSQMINQTAGQNGTFDILALLRHLARRNLLRGYRLNLPTGQAAAEALGITPLTPAQITQGVSQPVAAALRDGGFDTRTPLWYYVLREAETTAQGNSLGAVGSRIVAESIIGQIRFDQSSYLNQEGWTPADGVRLPDGTPVDSITGILRFAGVL